MALTKPTSEQVTFLQSGAGAVMRDVDEKLRESVSVKDFGAVGDGVADDTDEIFNATDDLGAVVPAGNFLVTELVQYKPFRLVGLSPDSLIFNNVVDKSVIDSSDDGTSRNTNVVIANMRVSQNGDPFTNNNYFALKLGGTDDSYLIANTVDGARYGVTTKYGSASLGPYSGNPATEAQPKRAPRANLIALNTLKEIRSMGIETFGAYKTRIIGNAIDNESTTAGSHSYRFTGYPGIPCQYNVAQGNIGGNSLTGISMQVAVHANDLSGFVLNDVTVGVQLLDNATHPSYFSKLNRVSAIVDRATTGAQLVGPQHSEYNLIVNETSGQSFFAGPSTYGDNRGCFFNVIARDANVASGAAIQVQTNNNIGKFIIDDSTVSGIRFDGSFNVYDVIVNSINGTSINVTGSNNIIRVVCSNNAGANDVVITGSNNTVTVNGSKAVSDSGTNNIVIGHCGSVAASGTGMNKSMLVIGGNSLQGSATYDPPSLADGEGATTTVAVTGARLGDFVDASFSLNLQSISVTAWVSASDVVSVRLQNETGGTIDLGSGTLRVRVRKV